MEETQDQQHRPSTASARRRNSRNIQAFGTGRDTQQRSEVSPSPSRNTPTLDEENEPIYAEISEEESMPNLLRGNEEPPSISSRGTTRMPPDLTRGTFRPAPPPPLRCMRSSGRSRSRENSPSSIPSIKSNRSSGRNVTPHEINQLSDLTQQTTIRQKEIIPCPIGPPMTLPFFMTREIRVMPDSLKMRQNQDARMNKAFAKLKHFQKDVIILAI
jgi:hypothetical protein